MDQSREKNLLTEQQYLQLERKAEHKSEFFKGEIFAMSGASDAHNLISENLAFQFYPVLRSKGCRGCINDMRLYIPENGLYTYPDFMIVCAEMSFLPDAELDTITNPETIIEILSPSTGTYDRGRKFGLYQGIKTLTQYVLIDSTEVNQVESFTLNDAGHWEFARFTSPSEEVPFRSIDFTLSLEKIYQGMKR